MRQLFVKNNHFSDLLSLKKKNKAKMEVSKMMSRKIKNKTLSIQHHNLNQPRSSRNSKIMESSQPSQSKFKKSAII